MSGEDEFNVPNGASFPDLERHMPKKEVPAFGHATITFIEELLAQEWPIELAQEDSHGSLFIAMRHFLMKIRAVHNTIPVEILNNDLSVIKQVLSDAMELVLASDAQQKKSAKELYSNCLKAREKLELALTLIRRVLKR